MPFFRSSSAAASFEKNLEQKILLLERHRRLSKRSAVRVRPSWHIAHDKRASRQCLLSLSSAEAAKLEIVLRFLRFYCRDAEGWRATPTKRSLPPACLLRAKSRSIRLPNDLR
jgi:hypothetical protein